MKKYISYLLSIVLLLFSVSLVTFAADQEYKRLSDPDLLPYIEATVYDNLITDLNSEDYFVQNVEAVYLSEEYLETVEYNSRENIYFGYTLSELESKFDGQKYVFNVNDKYETVAVPIEHYDDGILILSLRMWLLVLV